VDVRLPIESIEVATGQLLALGSEVEVIEPKALRNSIRGRLRELRALYR
jgi:predicted DNA-binding transcriptional regulator YafY